MAQNRKLGGLNGSSSQAPKPKRNLLEAAQPTQVVEVWRNPLYDEGGPGSIRGSIGSNQSGPQQVRHAVTYQV